MWGKVNSGIAQLPSKRGSAYGAVKAWSLDAWLLQSILLMCITWHGEMHASGGERLRAGEFPFLHVWNHIHDLGTRLRGTCWVALLWTRTVPYLRKYLF